VIIGALSGFSALGLDVQSARCLKENAIPQNTVVAKEIEVRGTFRFHEEFGLAVDLINRRAVDVKPLLTGCYGLDDVQAAFELAGDRSRSMKVQLSF